MTDTTNANIGTENTDKKDKGRRISSLEMRRSKPGYRIHDGITSMTNVVSNNVTNVVINSESPKYIPKYGWIPDIPDNRDYQYSDLRKKMEEIAEKEKEATSANVSPVRKRTIITVDGVQIPTPPLPFVDLRTTDSPIFNQGDLNSCTSNALVGTLQFLEKKDKKEYIELSRLFVYYDQRVVENTINIDIGAKLRDGIKTLAKLGVCSETCWPYNIQNFAVQPGHRCYREAANHMILTYYRINTLDEMKHCLDNGYPFVFGFSVYQSMETEEVAQTGIVNMPTADESLLGGLTVTCVGYDDNTNRFLVRNSRGINWGQKGYMTIPYAYLENRNLSDDFWAIFR